jgi:ribosomal protein S6--L-glutamate ligase
MRMIALLSGGNSGWHVDDLRRAAGMLDEQIVCCSWRNLKGGAGGGRIAEAGDVTLDAADAVILRSMPGGTLEQIILRMDLAGRLARSGVVVVNPPRAIEVAVDKYLALARIEEAGLPVPPTRVCQRAADAMAAFEELGGDVLAKPLFGSEGLGIVRVDNTMLAERVFSLLERAGSVMYVQKFIPHAGSDLRLMVLSGRMIGAMRRVGEGWRTNVSRGGRGEPAVVDGDLCKMAVRAAAACECVIAGVDILHDRDGRPWVLEVNAVPGWRALASVTGVDVAAELLHDVRRRVEARKAAGVAT